MIRFFSENNFSIPNPKAHESWLIQCLKENYKKQIGELNFIFCDDEYLLTINQEYLNHDYYTDVIGFNDSLEDQIHGDIFISTQRVQENAKKLGIDFLDEIARVMIHGILHFIGFDDSTILEKEEMRAEETCCLELHAKLVPRGTF